MAVTKYLPLAFSDYWLGTTGIASNVMLLRDDVTSIPETITSNTDLWTYEVADGGGYVAGDIGMAGPVLNRLQDATSGAVEYTSGSQLWQTDVSLTVTGYQWIVMLSSGTPLVVWKLDASSSLTGTPLTITLDPSPYITGSFPVLRFLRNTA